MPKEQTIFEKDLLQSVLEGIEESIVVIDRDYHIVYFNKAFEGWVERPKKRIIGEGCYSVIHDQPVRCTTCIVRETFRTGQFFETSHSHDLGNGRRVYHETRSYPLKDASGDVKYAIYIFRDVTERALIEEKVRELDRFKKKILDNAGVAINVLDKDGNVTSSNKGTEELFGYTEDEVKGEPHGIFYQKGGEKIFAKAIQEALEKGKFTGEVTLAKKNKESFPADLTLTTVEDDSGNPVAFIEIIQDLTQLKKAERVIKQQLEKLKQVDAMKEEYFYATSHEFKTPLTTIASMIKLLLDGKLGMINDKQKEALELVYCDSKRLRASVQKVLDLAKIESGKMFYNIEKIDLNPIVDEIVQTVRILADSKELTINKKLDGDLPLVAADRERLALVIENLLSNSVKFTPKGGTINVIASKEGDNVLVEVRDTGVGIPDADKEKIFQKYYQANSGMGSGSGGSGLGLVICKKIVDALGGKIWVESKLGEGSAFKFTLPLKMKNEAGVRQKKAASPEEQHG